MNFLRRAGKWIQRDACRLFGDAQTLKELRSERERIIAARKKAEEKHVEDTQDILAMSIRELLDSESAASALEAAIKSAGVKDDDRSG